MNTHELICTLDSHATVFQAEIKAIRECAEWVRVGGVSRRLINICSDSRATLLALDANCIDSTEVLVILASQATKKRIDSQAGVHLV